MKMFSETKNLRSSRALSCNYNASSTLCNLHSTKSLGKPHRKIRRSTNSLWMHNCAIFKLKQLRITSSNFKPFKTALKLKNLLVPHKNKFSKKLTTSEVELKLCTKLLQEQKTILNRLELRLNFLRKD